MDHKGKSRDESRDTRPSLFTDSTLARGEADSQRMLAGLSSPGSSSAKTARSDASLLAAVVSIGVLLIGVGIWTLWSREVRHDVPTIVARSTAAPRADVSAAPGSAASPPSAPPSTVDDPKPATASIETVPTPAPQASATPPPIDPREAAAPVATARAATATPDRPIGRQAAHAAPSATQRTQRLAAAPQRRAASTSGQRNDADVDLLAAVMSHVQGDHTRAAHTANHDRLESRTIAQLVERCQRLEGSKEAQCRREICEGSWGKAEACPMRLAPGR